MVKELISLAANDNKSKEAARTYKGECVWRGRVGRRTWPLAVPLLVVAPQQRLEE